MLYSSKWPTRNAERYPAGVACGVDYTHPAASAGLLCSAVSGVKNLIDVKSGIVGTLVSTGHAASIDGVAGPCVGGFASGVAVTIPGPTAARLNFTMAAIFTAPTSVASMDIFSDSTGASALSMNFNLTFRIFFLGGSAVSSGLSLTTSGGPYFAAVSNDGTTARFVLLDIPRGTLSTASVAGITTTTGTPSGGAYTIGNRSSSLSVPFLGKISAIMYSSSVLSLHDLIQWGRNPWSFWYPDAGEEYIAAQAGFVWNPMRGPVELPGYVR